MTKNKNPFKTEKDNLPPIKELTVDRMTTEQALLYARMQPGTRWFTMGQCTIYVSPPAFWMGWHLAISRNDRHPDWSEVVKVTKALLPPTGRYAIMIPTAESPDSDRYILHVQQIRFPNNGTTELHLSSD